LYAYSEYDPEVIMYTSIAKGISSELRDGDIVLPNVFFEYDNSLNDSELDTTNRDKYLKDPIFLEQYSIQKDYDFENF
jgi:nucleoside phosphorylase